MNIAVKCGRNIIADNYKNYSCGQCQADGRLDHWSGSRDSWWVIKYKETSVVAVLELLIIKCTAEKKNMFHIHCSVTDSDVEFIHKICLNYEFNKFKGH